jgi:hypothetical protein
LTDPEDNRDGEQRRFLDNPEWECLDFTLLGKLRSFRDRNYRTFENFERDQILPVNTLYYKNKVSTQDGRGMWHKQAFSDLSQAELIFLDQDNGFEVKSMTGRTQQKYALYKEAFDFYNSGKIVIGIQFASKIKPSVRVVEVREKLIPSKGCSNNVTVFRGRVTPNILFFSVCPLNRVRHIEEALKSFAAQSPSFKKHEKRVELIP